MVAILGYAICTIPKRDAFVTYLQASVVGGGEGQPAGYSDTKPAETSRHHAGPGDPEQYNEHLVEKYRA